MRALALSVLLLVVGCRPSSSSPTRTTPPGHTSAPFVTPAPTPTENLAGVPACVPSGLTLAKAGYGGGLTFGGDWLSVNVRAASDCRLTSPPAVTVVDTDDRSVTVGRVALRDHKMVYARGENTIDGEWRDVCAVVRKPLRFRVVLQGSSHEVLASGEDPPICYRGKGDVPATPYTTPPSGYLNLSYESQRTSSAP